MKEHFLLGTYTKKTSQGIYTGTLDTVTGQVDEPQLYLEVENPTYLQQTPDGQLISIASQWGQGGVLSYAMNRHRLNNRVLDDGPNPCHVCVDNERQLVFTANYHKGTITSYRLNPDHTLSRAVTIQHTGNGPRPEQESAHVHMCGLTPNKRLFAVDLGNDTLTTYNVTDQGGLFAQAIVHFPAGYGPRHLAFVPHSNTAYIVGELSSQVSRLKYEPLTGLFRIEQTVPTIPADWSEYNGCAAVRVSADGRFVYVSNRGYNTIAVFATQNDTLTLIQQISTAGDFPRDFALDPTEHFVLAVNQKSDSGTLYARDQRTGKLTIIQQGIATPEAICVSFAHPVNH